MKSPLTHLIVWLVLCVAALGGYGYWYAVVTDTSTTVASLEREIQTKATNSIRAATARTALADIADDEALVQGYFVPETGVVPFIDTLEALARTQSATMKVLSVSTSGSAQDSNLTLLLTITLGGTFDAVMRTIGAIEYASYDIAVSRLSLGNDGKNVWHANLEITVGSMPATAQATSTSMTQPREASPYTL